MTEQTTYDPALAPRSLADEVVPNVENQTHRDNLIQMRAELVDSLQLFGMTGWKNVVREATERLEMVQSRMFTSATSMDEVHQLRGRAQELAWLHSLEERTHRQIEHIDAEIGRIELEEAEE